MKHSPAQRHTPTKVAKGQVNWRLSEQGRELARLIALDMGGISQGAALEIMLRAEGKRRGIVVKPLANSGV